MNKTKSWKWLLIIAILAVTAWQIDQRSNTYAYPPFHIVDFPTFQQPDNITCGPSCVLLMLKHYQKEQSLDDIKKVTRTEFFTFKGEKFGGTTAEYMQIALEKYGAKSTVQRLDMDRLKYYISQGRYPACCVRSGEKMWHWVVAIGYTPTHIIISDPGWGTIEKVPNEVFENAWNYEGVLYGEKVLIPCSFCGGDGYLVNVGFFGKCDFCGGTGKLPDIYWEVVFLGESIPYTAIIPDRDYNANLLPNQ